MSAWLIVVVVIVGVRLHPSPHCAPLCCTGSEDAGLMMQAFHKKGTWVTDVGLVFKTADGSGLRKVAIHAIADEVRKEGGREEGSKQASKQAL